MRLYCKGPIPCGMENAVLACFPTKRQCLTAFLLLAFCYLPLDVSHSSLAFCLMSPDEYRDKMDVPHLGKPTEIHLYLAESDTYTALSAYIGVAIISAECITGSPEGLDCSVATGIG